MIIHAENNFLLLFAFGYNETSIVSLLGLLSLSHSLSCFVGQFPCGGGDDFIFINKHGKQINNFCMIIKLFIKKRNLRNFWDSNILENQSNHYFD